MVDLVTWDLYPLSRLAVIARPHQLWVWFGQGCVKLDSQGPCYVNLDYSHLNPMFPHMWGPPLTLVNNAFVPYIPIFCPLPPSHPYLIITLYDTKTRLVCALKTITCPRFLSLTCSLSMYGWRLSIHVGIGHFFNYLSGLLICTLHDVVSYIVLVLLNSQKPSTSTMV